MFASENREKRIITLNTHKWVLSLEFVRALALFFRSFHSRISSLIYFYEQNLWAPFISWTPWACWGLQTIDDYQRLLQILNWHWTDGATLEEFAHGPSCQYRWRNPILKWIIKLYWCWNLAQHPLHRQKCPYCMGDVVCFILNDCMWHRNHILKYAFLPKEEHCVKYQHQYYQWLRSNMALNVENITKQ